jgi:hypothetical protein
MTQLLLVKIVTAKVSASEHVLWRLLCIGPRGRHASCDGRLEVNAVVQRAYLA